MRFRWIALGVAGFAILAVVSFACRSGDGSQGLESCLDMVLAHTEAQGDDLLNWVRREGETGSLTVEQIEALGELQIGVTELYANVLREECAKDPVHALELPCELRPDAFDINERLWQEQWCP